MNILSKRESTILKEKDVIKEVNGKCLALIMNRLRRINSYIMTKSIDNSNPLNIIVFIILRVRFQIFSRINWN